MGVTPIEELADEFDADLQGDLPETLDRAAVERMRVVARLLDESVPVPGTPFRVGIDPLIGVAPVAGDLVTTALSLYIVVESARLGVSHGTLLRMLANVSLDFVGGSVPVLGTVFDAAWKANKWNVRLFLEEFASADGRREEPLAIDIS